MGRVKLEIKKIEHKSNRLVTYTKRRNGLLKKAYELSILCDIDIGVIMFSESGVPKVFCSKGKKIEDLVIRLGNISLQRELGQTSNNTKELREVIETSNVEQSLEASIAPYNDLQQENKLLRASLTMMNQEVEFWKQNGRKWNGLEHGLEQITSLNNYELMTLKGEVDEATRKVLQRMQQVQQEQGHDMFEHHWRPAGFFENGDTGSKPVLAIPNEDVANMPSTSQHREVVHKDFQNNQQNFLGKAVMEQPLCNYDYPIDLAGNQGAQILYHDNLVNSMGGQGDHSLRFNYETMEIGQGSQMQSLLLPYQDWSRFMSYNDPTILEPLGCAPPGRSPLGCTQGCNLPS